MSLFLAQKLEHSWALLIPLAGGISHIAMSMEKIPETSTDAAAFEAPTVASNEPKVEECKAAEVKTIRKGP